MKTKESVTKRLLEIVGLETITPEINEKGVVVDVRTAMRIIDELSCTITHGFRGHAVVEDLCNVSYQDSFYISYDRDDVVYVSSHPVYINKSTSIKLYISPANWYDLHIANEHGYVTICCFPKN